MSRGDFGTPVVTYGSTSASFYRSQPFWQNEKFNELSDSVSGKIFLINKNVSSLESISKKIEESNGGTIEQKIHAISQETNQLANDIKHLFKKISELAIVGQNQQVNQAGQYVNHQNKLRKEFENSLSRYHTIQNVIALKMKSYIQKEVSKSHTFYDEEKANLIYDSDKEKLLNDETRRTQQLLMQKQDLEELKEKESRLNQIEEDILNVNEIFRDLALLVHEQGNAIDSIESNIEHAAIHVEQGNAELIRAKVYQRSARKRFCCLALISIVIAVILGLIIYYSVK